MWYFKGSNESGTPTFHLMQREDGNWNELAYEVTDYLNKFVPPHMLIDVSLYEDQHPNDGKVINAVIAHSAGTTP